MKVNETFDYMAPTSRMFPNHNSFDSYNASIGINVPYIAAEISSVSYTAMTTPFIVGGGSLMLNDVNEYVNGPLEANTLYTVFVWGFSPVPQVRMRIFGLFLLLLLLLFFVVSLSVWTQLSGLFC